MTRPGAEAVEARYRAFISYSHTDEKFAVWLHRKLEGFALPARDGERPARLAPCFIDRAELAAGPDLSVQVKQAVAQSEAMVVVCSPAAANSAWVAQEIALFRQLHPDRPVLAALLEDEPARAFPVPLIRAGGKAFEPLAADFRKQGDGRRIALLKIVAGLSGLPLDELVQREVQARLRRVMIITAAAALLVVVLSTLLVIALRERAEAQRQRAEAEGMVEYMLTDLRDRLKGVGRLEIMDSVNRRAMEHYEGDRNLADLPADVLQRRARLLIALGEDDKMAGKTDDARRVFAEAYRVTSDLLARDPDNTERLFNHAQSEYWVGSIPFDAGDKAATQPHWTAYRTLARKMVALEPHEVKWQRELGYAEANLCALAQARPAEPETALVHCEAAARVTGAIAQDQPGDIQAQIDYANNLAWQADAALKSGRNADAVALRLRQQTLVDTLPDRFPGDSRVDQARLQAGVGLAITYAVIGEPEKTRATARTVLAIGDALARRDPTNSRWNLWRERARTLLADPIAEGRRLKGAMQ